MEYKIVTGDELYHWGIKGMKWGIRRYQNKDGSLTAAGRKRRAKLEAELKTLKGNKKSAAATKSASKTEKAAQEIPRKKRPQEMTDEELREATNRMRAEKDYYDAARGLAQSNPKKVSLTKRFFTSLVKDVVAPAATNAGKAYVEKIMKKKLGLEEKVKKSGDVSIEDLLKPYMNIPEDQRKQLAEAAKIRENINKLNKSDNK